MGKSRFLKHMRVFLFVVPAIYIALAYSMMFFHEEVVYYGWKQVSLPGEGFMYIPNEWNLNETDDGAAAIITGQSIDNLFTNEAEEEIYFLIFKLYAYREAVREGNVPENLDTIINSADTVSSGNIDNVEWHEYEYVDSSSGEKARMYQIIVHRSGDYILLSTSQSLDTPTVLKIAQSFLFNGKMVGEVEK